MLRWCLLNITQKFACLKDFGMPQEASVNGSMMKQVFTLTFSFHPSPFHWTPYLGTLVTVILCFHADDLLVSWSKANNCSRSILVWVKFGETHYYFLTKMD